MKDEYRVPDQVRLGLNIDLRGRLKTEISVVFPI